MLSKQLCQILFLTVRYTKSTSYKRNQKNEIQLVTDCVWCQSLIRYFSNPWCDICAGTVPVDPKTWATRMVITNRRQSRYRAHNATFQMVITPDLSGDKSCSTNGRVEEVTKSPSTLTAVSISIVTTLNPLPIT